MRRGSLIVVPNIHANSKTGQAVLADRQKPDQMTVAERGTKEVADVIVFIASPRAYWINGRNIPMDGLEQPHAPLDRRAY